MLEDGIPRVRMAGRSRPSSAATGKSTDRDAAAALEAAPRRRRDDERLAAYRSVFFTDDGEPRGQDLATKGVAAGLCAALLGGAASASSRSRDRLRRGRDARAHAARSTGSPAPCGPRPRPQKRRLGALDFADLIRQTLELLERGRRAWVLYKLDRGIDHVLVDEAQDTNPDQWRILRRLTEEFTAGAGRPVAGRPARSSRSATRSSRSTPSRAPIRAGSRTAAGTG